MKWNCIACKLPFDTFEAYRAHLCMACDINKVQPVVGAFRPKEVYGV